MLTDHIYCFYWELGNKNEPPLIEYWKERWQREGWTPIVLGPNDAKKDSRFQALCDKHDHVPFLPGHRDYGKANFCRWAAFAQINGAVCDYDVIPVKPFPPQDFGGFIAGTPTGAPGFVVGTSANFSNIVDEIINYVPSQEDAFNGVPHVCDMSILMRGKQRYDKLMDLIAGCLSPGTGQPLAHFDNTYLVPYDKVSRVDKIRALVESVYL
jgi:hypothetical protein